METSAAEEQREKHEEEQGVGRRPPAQLWEVLEGRKGGLFNSRQAQPPAVPDDSSMGDKSLKAKQRDQKQRDAAKLEQTAAAKTKQQSHMRVPQPAPKPTGKA